MNLLTAHIRKAGAFTLVEAVIATLLVTTMTIGIVSMMTYSRSYARLDRERAAATAHAARKMENLKRQMFTKIAPSRETVVLDNNGTPGNPDDDLLGNLEVNLYSSNGQPIVAPPNEADLLKVEITVSWNPSGRLSQKRMKETLCTYITP
ncbi:MAG TPA: hypothetical protein PLB62_05380 [Candidatus Sumerlaeota bacterium]|nr:hypothetical protein [Candidatus Sumerlaeota bacterium]